MRKLLATIIMCLMTVCLFLSACGSEEAEPAGASPSPDETRGSVTISFEFDKQSGYASNQFAIWIEDAEGNFVKSLYATRFTANGGYVSRPESIATWVASSGLADADAVSGATPKAGPLTYTWDLTGLDGETVPNGTYRFLVEGSLRWRNSVLFTGEIAIGGDAASADAEPVFTFEDAPLQSALDESAEETSMIGYVRAEYQP